MSISVKFNKDIVTSNYKSDIIILELLRKSMLLFAIVFIICSLSMVLQFMNNNHIVAVIMFFLTIFNIYMYYRKKNELDYEIKRIERFIEGINKNIRMVYDE